MNNRRHVPGFFTMKLWNYLILVIFFSVVFESCLTPQQYGIKKYGDKYFENKREEVLLISSEI